MTAVEKSSWTEIKNTRLPQDTERYLVKLAEQSPDKEVCGFITKGGTVLPIDNVDENPRRAFFMDRDQMLSAISNHIVTGIYHSHPTGDGLPSTFDTSHMSYLYRQGCPWDYYIVTKTGVHRYEHQDRK